jgi:thiol-disulfide isomerase/thioredoxin
MTRARSSVLLAISVSFLFAGFTASAQSRVKQPAKPASLIDVQPIDFAGLKELIKRDPEKAQPLLVNFWATWCDPCRDEFPDLVKLDQEYRSKGLQFVAVSLDDVNEIKTSVPKFLQQVGATMPAYLLNVVDPEPAINFVDSQWSGALPATVLYDAQGQVAFKHFGRIKPEELRVALDRVLEKSR